MNYLKYMLLILLSTLSLNAQNFYVLTDVGSYSPIVISNTKELKVFDTDIKGLMQSNALELGVNTLDDNSRVLAFIVSKFSVGETLGVHVALELGEYVRRKGSEDEIFALSYVEEKVFEYVKEELEDDLADTIEEMLELFALQYIEDNKKHSVKKKTTTHETFAEDMGYEESYKTALLKAKKEGKNLMVFMTTAYCPWCRKLENRILSVEHIDKKIKEHHVPVILNFREKKFPKALEKISIVPTLYIVNAKTEKIEETFIGFSAGNMFLNYLENIDEK